jgi:hypothetical protein
LFLFVARRLVCPCALDLRRVGLQHDRLDALAGYSSLLEYHIYTNCGIGDPIDYTVTGATTGLRAFATKNASIAAQWAYNTTNPKPI